MKLKDKLIPFSIAVFVIILDQVTKFLIVAGIEPYTIKYTFLDGFLRIIHVRNKAIAFSMGQNLPDGFRTALFSFLPLIILFLLIIYIIKTDEITVPQRWALGGIVGGGFGNLIDRFFRPDGVVDFIDVKFYGIFGLERWPTFNVADSSIVVFGIFLFFTMIWVKKEKE
ncbi:MAG: signal peptidase II [Spirochaetia bacterium]|jgi:signal peptidase II|nr:signal peptidase II [Spirochaetia bacterium]